MSGSIVPDTRENLRELALDARLMRGDRYRRNVIGICTVTERNTPMTTTADAPVATRVPGVLRPGWRLPRR